MNRLAIVVPCYNEEEVLPDTFEKLSEVIRQLAEKNKIAENSFVLYVNDGSRDQTWELIKKESEKNKSVSGLNLAANVGHQNALLAGLDFAQKHADVSISIDADLQDDTAVMESMIEKYNEGAEIVYGVRNDRKTDSFFKRTTAQSFYKIMEHLGVRSVYNHADYRLMSARAMEQLSKYKERNMFLRGIVPLLGYKTDYVCYARKERQAGESKYPLKKMISFAFDGITSFSVKPITMIMFLGIAIVFFSIIAFIYILVSYFMNRTSPGWSSLMVSIWFLGGLQLFAIGVIGEYIGKIYIEVKERPRYNVEQILHHEEENEK